MERWRLHREKQGVAREQIVMFAAAFLQNTDVNMESSPVERPQNQNVARQRADIAPIYLPGKEAASPRRCYTDTVSALARMSSIKAGDNGRSLSEGHKPQRFHRLRQQQQQQIASVSLCASTQSSMGKQSHRTYMYMTRLLCTHRALKENDEMAQAP